MLDVVQVQERFALCAPSSQPSLRHLEWPHMLVLQTVVAATREDNEKPACLANDLIREGKISLTWWSHSVIGSKHACTPARAGGSIESTYELPKSHPSRSELAQKHYQDAASVHASMAAMLFLSSLPRLPGQPNPRCGIFGWAWLQLRVAARVRRAVKNP